MADWANISEFSTGSGLCHGRFQDVTDRLGVRIRGKTDSDHDMGSDENQDFFPVGMIDDDMFGAGEAEYPLDFHGATGYRGDEGPEFLDRNVVVSQDGASA